MNDKNKVSITKGASVTVRLGAETIKGKVTGMDAEQGRVSIRDDHRGKGTRGEFSIEAHAVEVVTTKRSTSKLP